MRKIVHISTRLINGGAEENTILTCNHQANSGHSVWLVYGADYRQRMVDWVDPKVHRIMLPSLVREISPFRDLAALWRIARLLRRIDPDVVHTHQSKAGILGRLASGAAPSAHVVHGVHILAFVGASWAVRLVYIALEKLAARRTDTFISVSPRMRDLCLSHRLGAPEKHFVVPSGMDIQRFHRAAPAPDVAAIRDMAGGQSVIACYLAVFEPRKRHRELLDAVAPALAEDKRVHLVLAGDGHLRPDIEALIERRSLTEQVHILGFREDPERVIAASDICIFASVKEGLPRVVVQYAAVGRPIVATRLPGIDIVLRDGKNGYVVESDDLAGLAKRFGALAGDANKRKRMARCSGQIDLSGWEADNMVRRIEEIYARDRSSQP